MDLLVDALTTPVDVLINNAGYFKVCLLTVIITITVTITITTTITIATAISMITTLTINIVITITIPLTKVERESVLEGTMDFADEVMTLDICAVVRPHFPPPPAHHLSFCPAHEQVPHLCH
jgi:hypothetical protein